MASRRIRKLTSELTGYLEELEELQARRKTIVDYFNISQVDAEIKVVSRKISDKRIRIRNLEKATTRNNKINSLNNSKLSHSFIKLLEELNSNGNNSASESIICEHEPIEDNDSNINETGSDKIDINEGIVRDDDILYEDEEFDPNESELERVRPSSRICPSYPLPHSMQKLSPFYLKRVGLWKDNYILGLNTTLLDDGRFTSVEDQDVDVDWGNMSVGGTHGYYRGNRNRYRPRYGKFRPIQEKLDHVEPCVDAIVKNNNNNLVRVVRRLSEECICQREPDKIVCTGADCDYSFTGRLETKCSVHPDDWYLMDHPPLCPKCSNKLVSKSVHSKSMKKVIDEVNDDDFVKVNRVNTSTPNKAKDRVTDEAKLEDGAQMDRVITSKPRLVHVKPSALKSNKEDKCLN